MIAVVLGVGVVTLTVYEIEEVLSELDARGAYADELAQHFAIEWLLLDSTFK